jgi:excisionase family DNA binding protein
MSSIGLENELLTVSEIAQALKVPVSWIYERCRRRGSERIPHIKLGKYLRFEITAVQNWLTGLRNY